MRKIVVNNEILLDQAAQIVAQGSDVTITIKGESMYPFLRHGGTAVLKPITSPLQKMDIILAKVNGKYIMHRLLEVKGERVEMMGDGNLLYREYCTLSDVVAIIPRSKKDLKYANLWLKLLPIRRYLISFMRRILHI